MSAAAAARAIAPRPSTREIFVARCEARALLWQAGEIDLHTAVDELYDDAVGSGLAAVIGQDAVQKIMATAFAAVREDTICTPRAEVAWAAPGWHEATVAYREERGDAPGKKLGPPKSAEANDRVSGTAASTLHAAEYLIRLGDPQRWAKWFDAHSAQERADILQHLESRKKRRT